MAGRLDWYTQASARVDPRRWVILLGWLKSRPLWDHPIRSSKPSPFLQCRAHLGPSPLQLNSRLETGDTCSYHKDAQPGGQQLGLGLLRSRTAAPGVVSSKKNGFKKNRARTSRP